MKVFISFFLLLALFSLPVLSQDESERGIETQEIEIEQEIEQEKVPPADSLLDASFMKGFVNKQMKKMVMDYIKDNPFSKMSEPEVQGMIMSNVKGKPAEKFFNKFPKFLKALVNWVRDPKAIPAFLNIINKPKLIKNYGIAVLVVFILSFALNLMNSKGSLFRRIGYKMLIMVGALVVNIGMFYVFFQEEVGPTVEVMKRTFFG